MAGRLTINVNGVPELQKAFANLAGPVAEKALTKGVIQAAQVFQESITENAPVRPALPSGTALPVGKLKQSIQIRARKLKSGAVAAFVEPSAETRHIARFVEYGHQLISGGRQGKGGKFAGRVPPHPFVRPAYEVSAQDAIELMQQTILEVILEEADDLEDESGDSGGDAAEDEE